MGPRVLYLIALIGLGACGTATPPPVPIVSRMSPEQLLICAQNVLAGAAVQTAKAPIGAGEWRLRLAVLTGPPTGWLEKGDLVHDGVRMLYLADGSTAGLMDKRVEAALAQVGDRCK